MTNEEIFTFIRKNPIGIGCGVVSLVLGGLIYWRSDLQPEAEAELTTKSTEADRYKANLNSAANLQDHYEALVAANKIIDSRVVRASQFGKNLAYFYDLESETGIKLTADPRTSPVGAKNPKSTYISTSWALSMQGTMPQLLAFLRRLENGAHYCRVLSFSLTSGTDRNAPLNLTLNIELLGLP